MSVPGTSGLREFIESYRRRYEWDFLEIDKEVSVEFDTTTYSLLRNNANKVLLFSNLLNYEKFSILTNLLGSETRVLHATGSRDMGDFNRRFSSALNSNLKNLVQVKEGSAPFMRNVLMDGSVDLNKLPVPSHYPLDGAKSGNSRYITSGIVAVREFDDPETINLSFTRIQLISRNRYAFDAGSHGHLWNHLYKAAEKDEEAELTVLIGTHPIFYLLAASFIDNEYEKAASFVDVELSKGLSNDILIPTETEIVLEAKFLPRERFDEGPFAEYTGYMGNDTTRYVAEVRSVLMRDNPIYYDIQPSNSSEHVNIFSLPRSSVVSSALQRFMPQGTDFMVHWPHSGARFLSNGWVDPPSLSIAKQLGISIMSLDPLWGKIIFINLGRCELDFLSTIARLLNTKGRMSNCVFKFPDMFVIGSDFTADPERSVCKSIFITNSRDSSYTREVRDGELILKGRYGNAVITHKPRDDNRINIVLGEDIDLTNTDKILWAIATRVNPQDDLDVTDDKITIRANRVTPEIPSLDPNSKRRISEMFPEQEKRT